MKSVEFATEEHCLRPTLRLAIVTETYPPEVNGVAMTLGRMVDGLLAQGHHIQLVRPRQTRSDAAVDADNAKAFETLLRDFLGWQPIVPGTSAQLAQYLALMLLLGRALPCCPGWWCSVRCEWRSGG